MLDIDEVLFSFIDPFLEFYNSRNSHQNGVTYRRKDIWTFDLSKVFMTSAKFSDGEIYAFFQTDSFRKLNANKGAVELVKAINGEGLAITSRPNLTINATRYNLDLRFGKDTVPVRYAEPYSPDFKQDRKVYLTKAQICKEEGIRFAIEDSYSQAKILGDVCEQVFLINAPWNQNDAINAENRIRRINSLDEILNQI